MRNQLQICVLVLAGIACLLTCGQEARAQIEGGMLDPDLDKAGEPFSYVWRPNEVLGALYAPVASEVTPEGNLWTGFGERMFYVGKPLMPVNERMRTLLEGYLPVVQYNVVHRGVQYTFTMFATDLGAALEGLPVNFVQVEMTNKSQEQRAAFLTSAFRVRAPYEIRSYRLPKAWRERAGSKSRSLDSSSGVIFPKREPLDSPVVAGKYHGTQWMCITSANMTGPLMSQSGDEMNMKPAEDS